MENFKFLTIINKNFVEFLLIYDVKTNKLYDLRINNDTNRPQLEDCSKDYGLDEHVINNILEEMCDMEFENDIFNMELYFDLKDYDFDIFPKNFVMDFISSEDKDLFIKNQDNYILNQKLIEEKFISEYPERKEIDYDIIAIWYNKYLDLGGKHDIEKFLYYLNVLIATTKYSYKVNGEVFSNEKCIEKWENFIGDIYEANLYRKAVDFVSYEIDKGFFKEYIK
jgi:hypothetical protein